MTITARKALRQLVEAALRVPEHIADRYGLSEPLRILRDPEAHSRVARFFGSSDPDAVALGARGGAATKGITSEAKKAASRANVAKARAAKVEKSIKPAD